MPGYSGTSLAKKLGIKPSDDVRLVGAPDAFEEALTPLPDGARLTRDEEDASRFAVQLIFATSRSALTNRLGDALLALPSDGMVWLAWPKQSSSISTDLSRDEVRDVGLLAGLVDVKVCAIDEVWSGLKFVVRVEDRPQWPQRRSWSA